MNKEYKEKIEKLKQELLIMKTLNIKPNYSELSRIYKIDRRTIKKYNNGNCRKNITIIRKSKLDDLKNFLHMLWFLIMPLYYSIASFEQIAQCYLVE